MREHIAEMRFETRSDFRAWLNENAETSDGIWLAFDKTKTKATLSANDALEEALCFGWIDGQMRRMDDKAYLKYFARRRAKSVWSEKNKKLVAALRENNRMTALGEKAVATAIENGQWDAPKPDAVTDDQIAAFTEKLAKRSPAYENFNNMPLSVRRTYTRRYLSFKTEEARQKDFEKIVDRLNKNLKPM